MDSCPVGSCPENNSYCTVYAIAATTAIAGVLLAAGVLART